MKTKLFSTLVLILSMALNLKGQVPTITAVNAQIVGDSITVYRCDTLGLNPGPSGTNVTWNFSTLDSIGVVYRYTMLPSNTPYPTIYPTSNRAEKTVSGASSNYQFYNTQNDSVITVGTSGGVIDSTIYKNSDKSMIFPFTYLNNFRDSSIAFSYYNTGGLRNRSYHSRNTTADGYGTLILPNATYTNVLRYKVVHEEIDSLFSGPTFSTKFIWHIEEYFWVDAGYRAYLLYANPVKIKNGVPQAKSVHYVADPYPVILTGVRDLSNDGVVSVFPNPFSTQTTFQGDKIFNNATLTVYNLYGQEVKQIKDLSGKTISFDRNILPAGLYFACITQDNQMVMEKKIVITD